MTQPNPKSAPSRRPAIVVFTLGGPSVPEALPLFDAYQRDRNGGPQDKRWEQHEAEVVRRLFAKESVAQNLFESIIVKLGGPALSIAEPYHAIGNHRGLWLKTIAVSADGVSQPGGGPGLWPPNSQGCRAISGELATMLRRQWVHSFTILEVS